MKTIIGCLLALGSITCLSSCVSVQRAPSNHTTTTTEQTTLKRPHSGTVETRTTRSY